MNGQSRWPSWLAVTVGALIALLSIVGCVVALRVSNEHEHELLEGQTHQAAELMQITIQNLYSSMGSIATAATLAHNDPAQFGNLSFPIKATNNASIVLAQKHGDHYVVIAAVGHAYSVGETITGPAAAALDAAGGTVTPTEVVRSGNGSTFGFVLGPPATPPGLAVYEQLTVPLHLLSIGNGPFNSVNFALYGAHTPAASHLVLDNTSDLPLHGDTVAVPVYVGNATWLAVGSAKEALSGSLARVAGWIILGMGLLIALLVGVILNGLSRRQQYAEVQVALRTAELAQSMADLKEAQVALVQRERLAAVGQMASVVGHELRNPLTALTNAIYLIRATAGPDLPEATMTHLELAEREVNRAATLAQDLTDFVRPRTPVPEPFGLDQLLEEIMQSSPPPTDVTVRAHVGRLIVVADRVQVGELLTNLITNAYQAIGTGGRVWVWAEPDATRVRLSVQDDGPGIDPDVASRIFEPFVTTKTRGTGLGLAIVRRIVDEHGGTVVAERREEGGTRIVATLPGSPEQNDVTHERTDEATAVWIGGAEGNTVRSTVKTTAGTGQP